MVKPGSGVKVIKPEAGSYAHVPFPGTTMVFSSPGVAGFKSTATLPIVAGLPSLNLSLVNKFTDATKPGFSAGVTSSTALGGS